MVSIWVLSKILGGMLPSFLEFSSIILEEIFSASHIYKYLWLCERNNYFSTD